MTSPFLRALAYTAGCVFDVVVVILIGAVLIAAMSGSDRSAPAPPAHGSDWVIVDEPLPDPPSLRGDPYPEGGTVTFDYERATP